MLSARFLESHLLCVPSNHHGRELPQVERGQPGADHEVPGAAGGGLPVAADAVLRARRRGAAEAAAGGLCGPA